LLPPLRWRLVPVPLGLHHPVWIEDPAFDLDWHVRRMGCPAPGGLRELCELISEITSRPLERDRPLWEEWLIEGLEGGRVAAVIKVHHALADGVASAQLLNQVFDDAADAGPPPIDDWKAERVPSKRSLLLNGMAHAARRAVSGLPTMLRGSIRSRRQRKIAGLAVSERPPKAFAAPKTRFNAPLTAHRSFAVATVDLESVRAVRSAFGTTINDVMLAAVAGGLRTYLQAHDSLPDSPLVASLPVSTREEGERPAWGNHLAQIFVTLPTHVADPAERLRAASASADLAKSHLAETRGTRIEDWIEALPAPLLRLFGRRFLLPASARRAPANVVISNVPGPRAPLYLSGGPVDAFYSIGPLLPGVGLNITAWSYVNQLNVSFLACRELVPDLWSLVDAVRESFSELEKAAEAGTRDRPRLR
jgi:WS/DGAT/MGAT family acyltransferase